MDSSDKKNAMVGAMKRKPGRPPKGAEKLGPRRTMRFTETEDREIDAALAVAGQEFSEVARPLVMTGMRRIIEKARKR